MSGLCWWCKFLDSPFYSHYNAHFFFGLTEINVFLDLCMWFFLLSINHVCRQFSSPSQTKNWGINCWLIASYAITTGPIWAESSLRRSARPRSATYCSDAPGEQLGVPLQLCMPGLSQTSAGILWSYDRHSRWWSWTDHADYGKRADHSDRPPAYQFCDRGPCSASLRNSVSWWGPSIDFLHNFFGTRPQREDKSHSQINIGAFAPMHRFLVKVVVTNLWPQARRSELTLKKATLLYAIVMRTPFCLCKHILHTMLEVRDEKNTSLSFRCLITQICLQVVPEISDSEPRSQIPYPLGIQTLMKSIV
jgi:hypothetical protein